MTVLGRDGVKLGTVQELFLDLESGTAEFLIVKENVLLRGSGRHRAVPYALMRVGIIAGHFTTTLTKDDFEGAPSYDPEQLVGMAYGWNDKSSRYFSGLVEKVVDEQSKF